MQTSGNQTQPNWKINKGGQNQPVQRAGMEKMAQADATKLSCTSSECERDEYMCQGPEGVNSPDQPQLGPPPPSLPIGSGAPFKFSPGLILVLLKLCWSNTSLQLSYIFACPWLLLVWTRPASRLPCLTSDVFHRCGPVWCSLSCV